MMPYRFYTVLRSAVKFPNVARKQRTSFPWMLS